jgi:hypothetical protein
LKAIIPVSADDDEVVDGVVVSSLRPETWRMIYLCLDTALFLSWLRIMYILISHRIFPLFGLPVLLQRVTWFFPAQKVWRELGIGEDGKPEPRKKRARRQ